MENHVHLQIEAYTYVDWAGNVMNRRSISGHCTLVGSNLVSQRSKNQMVLVKNSTEAEFQAAAHGICELVWLKKLLKDMKIPTPLPMMLYCDNKTAINIAHNPVQHDRTKHVEVDLKNGLIYMPYIPTEEQLADVLTKGLMKGQFDNLTCKLGTQDIFESA